MMNYENEQQARCPHHRHWPIRSNDRLNDRIYFSHTIWRERRIYPLRRCLDLYRSHSFAPPVCPGRSGDRRRACGSHDRANVGARDHID